MAEALDYVPLPENVVKLVEASWSANIKNPDNKPIWTAR
jgi:phosphate transport system substrate-binding protein